MLVTKPRSDFEPVHTLLMESLAAKVVMSAVELKIFDNIEGRTVEAAELAHEMGLVPERLEPFLDVLTAAKLLYKEDNGYKNTPIASEFLITDAPLYQGDSMALTMQFNTTVEQSITELVSGGTVDRSKTDDGWAVDGIMEGTAQDARGGGLSPVIEAISDLPDFSEFRSICDIGGNHGLYTLGILERNKNVHGTIFDLPHVAEQAQRRCDALGFGDRVTTRGLDFREDSLPAGQFDLAITSHVLYAFKNNLRDALCKIADGLKPDGWFVSHHYCQREKKGGQMVKASLELLTRLCGYPSHFIEKEELTAALQFAGFGNIRFTPASKNGLGLITCAQKTTS